MADPPLKPELHSFFFVFFEDSWESSTFPLMPHDQQMYSFDEFGMKCLI